MLECWSHGVLEWWVSAELLRTSSITGEHPVIQTQPELHHSITPSLRANDDEDEDDDEYENEGI